MRNLIIISSCCLFLICSIAKAEETKDPFAEATKLSSEEMKELSQIITDYKPTKSSNKTKEQPQGTIPPSSLTEEPSTN